MSDLQDDDGHRTKRFKHQSYNEQLKDVHAPSALSRSKVDEALEDEACLFHGALSHWMQLNLSPSFILFAQKALPLSQSLPLLVHSWREVTDLWLGCVEKSDDEALKALFDLLQKLAEDLRSTLAPAYDQIIFRLFSFLPHRISSDSLSGLLAALLSVFKYLLLPLVPNSDDNDVLGSTWMQLCASLEKCNPEVQRAVAEVWSSVLRRLKDQDRYRCVKLMISSGEGASNVVAWSLVFSAKSVAQSLHTCAPTLVLTCLEYHLAAKEDELVTTMKLIRRLLTALIHHCAKADQFSGIADQLIQKLISTVDSPCRLEDAKRMLDVLAVPCSVRQGSRLSPKQHLQILDTTIKLAYTNALCHSLLNVTTAALCASTADLSVWMSAGRRVVERAWEADAGFAVALTGALHDAGWKGLTQFALPSFTKGCLALLSSEEEGVNNDVIVKEVENEPSVRMQTLRVLSKFAKDGMLKNTNDVWRAHLAAWVRVWLNSFVISKESAVMLREVVSVTPLLSAYDLLPSFASIAQNLVDAGTDSSAGYYASWANETWVFGQLVRVLSSSKHLASLPNFDCANFVCAAVRKWPWSEYVMDAVTELAKTCRDISVRAVQGRDNAVVQLYKNLKSYSHTIRRSSLELLGLPWLIPNSTEEPLRRCLTAELVPQSVQGVRERVLYIGRLGQAVQTDNTRAAELCVAWLLGQLKVSLRPVWAPAAHALAVLSERFPDVVWSSVFFELKGVEDAVDGVSIPSWVRDAKEKEDEVNEEERSWRDPSAHKLRVVVAAWTSSAACRIALIEEQKPRDRFDEQAYEAQLLVALGEFPSLAEKHSRELVPLFLSFSSSPTEKASRTKLTNWLKLFSGFSNPKAFYASDTVHKLYISLLAHPDRALQSTVLSCLLTYKSPALLRHADKLRLLLDDTKWRDEVAALEMQKLAPNERAELVPVLVRLFFGMMRERGGRGKGADRRSALLGTLGACTEDELMLLVDLMIEPFLDQVDFELLDDGSGAWKLGTAPMSLPEKQQIGFLMFLADVLRNLGTLIAKSWPRLLVLTVTLTAHAQQSLQTRTADVTSEEELENENELDEEIDDPRSATGMRQLRIIRQLGLKRLAEFFRLPVEFDFAPYMTEVYRTVVSPRISLLDRENTQAPSALLDLLDVWSTRPNTAVYLVRYDSRTLTKIYDCLVATNVKPAVLTRIFDMIDRLLAFSTEDMALSDMLVKPYMSGLLANVATVVQRSTDSGSAFVVGVIAQREIAILSKLSPHITDGDQAATLLSLFLPQLRRAGKGIPEKAKVDMLNILSNLLSRIPDFTNGQAALFTRTYETLSYLFQLLRGRQARIALIEAFKVLARIDDTLSLTADLLSSLNSYSTVRMEEPDFDHRLNIFATLNEERWRALSGKEWMPLLHNMLHFIQDDGELSIRNNASLSMKRFLDALSGAEVAEMQACFVRILFPGLKRCLRSKSDLVRSEVMSVLAYAVEKCNNVKALQEMRVLLASGDEEANFFNNIFHIQIHRRNRALRRLGDYCDDPGFRSSTLQEIFIPVVNSFIAGSGTTDHHLVNEAVLTLGRIAKHLSWPAYYSLVQQYIKLATEKSSAERTHTRALVSVLDNFSFSLEDTFVEEPVAGEEEGDEQDDEHLIDTAKPSVTAKIHDAVNNRLLPNLLKHLEQRDELEEANRIPIAVGIAKVALHLPESSRNLQIPRLLTVLTQIFRSKSQETRDLTRETVCRIAVNLGPSYLPMIIRQLREALLRGPHLHVLAFVIHALLVRVTSTEHAATFNKLDDCVSDVVHVSAEVVFGQSGKDVESEGFKTKMKEVRGSSSKGMDSFAILAKYITPAATSNLLLPIKAIMQETESAKTMQVVDDVLRRMSVGLNANAHFGSPELLVFCHTLISQNARFFQESVRVQRRKAKKVNDAVVQLKRKVEVDSGHYSHNSWRFVSFGLDLFNTAYRRSRFDFRDANIMARLEPMVNVIGNTLYATNGSVVSAGLKATAQIVKCPLKNVEKSLPIFVRQTMEIVKQTRSTEADVTQTALRTLAVIIRDCSSSQLKEKDLTFLLELLTPDLEEVSRQTIAFSLLRAIVSRKFVVPEIYDLMDKIGEIMVTNQSLQVQELCRSVLLQFNLDYPQGKSRLKQHFAFLVKNLSYVFESGRTSVMELLNAIVAKFNDDIISEYADMLFVALVLVIANDDSSKCREMAAQLIRTLVGRLREEQRKTIMSHVHSWASRGKNPCLARVSCQTYGLMLDTLKGATKPYLSFLLEDMNVKIRDAATEFEGAEEADKEVSGADADWQTPYQALTTISKVFQVFPDILSEYSKISWSSITSLLLYPHAWVRTASCRLLGSLFSVTSVNIPDENLADNFPMSSKGMKEVANALSLQLKSEHLGEAHSLQIVKNLFYIGKCFYAIPTPEVTPNGGDREENENDEDGDEDYGNDTSDASNPLPWLFSRLSYQARSAHIAWRNKKSNQANWSRQPSAIFRWFAAMASYMDGARLERYLPHILSPLYRIAEDDLARDAQMDELKTLASELQDLVQVKVGTTTFAGVYNRIRQRVVAVRRERRTVRAIQVATNPQAAAKRKMHKNMNKKDSRKRKNSDFAEHKIRMKFSKRRKMTDS